MLKKMIAMMIIFYSGSSLALSLAGSFYINPMLSYISIGTNRLSFLGMTARLAAGYGDVLWEYFYLAGEIFATSRAITIHGGSNSLGNLRPHDSLGISLIPALILDSQIMAYGRLGAIQTDFNGVSSTKGGYQAGAGLEAYLGGKWSGRAEYVYTRYNSISGVGSPGVDEFAIGVLYRF